MKRWILPLVVLMTLTGSGCSGVGIKGTTPAPSAGRLRAEKIIGKLAQINDGLQRFKGVGRIVLVNGSTQQNARIAWVAEHPGKIRFTIIVGGRPQISMAANTSWYTLFRHDTGFYYRTRAANTSFGAFLPIRIQAADLTAILAGRIPIRDYDRAELVEDGGSGRKRLVLKKWWRTIEIIRFSEAPLEVSGIEYFNGLGQLEYRVTRGAPTDIDRFRIPMQIGIDVPGKARIEIGIERYWSDVSITEDMFVIPPPG